MKFNKKRKNILHGIGAKTAISHLKLAILIIIFAAISMFAIMNNYMRNTKETELLRAAMALSEMESGKEEFAYDEERVEFYEKATDSVVIFFNEEYSMDYSLSTGVRMNFDYTNLSIDWDVDETIILNSVDRYALASILKGETVADISSLMYPHDNIIFAGAPIYDSKGSVVAGVMLVQSIEILASQRNVVLRLLLFTAVVAIPIAVYISMRLARRLTRPMIKISEGAQRLAVGDYTERIDQETTDEIGGIANSLNALSGRLRRTVGNLKRERDMLDLVMNGINEGIIAVDWYMHTVHCNESFLRILEMERMPENIDEKTEYGSILKKCMRSNETEKVFWKDKSGNDLMAVASKLHSEEGIIIGAVCLVNDVSEGVRLEQMRKEYVANVSHELRTPLTGIRGMVEPLIDGVFETEEERLECYNVIYKETIRLEKLIKEMLDMSRLQDGRVVVDLEPIELRQIMYDALRRVEQTANEAGVSLALEADDHHSTIGCIGNEDRVLQVLTIFLDNALSFTPQGGHITIYAHKVNHYVKIGVRDTGCGIEPKDMPYIWERFYKVDKSRMRTKGTGLGLAIAKLVVELMNGEIGVNSEAGKGTDFWFRLPVATEGENEA